MSLHIVHSEASCGWGGQEIRIIEEALGLQERGHQVSILCPPESKICSEAPKRGVTVVAMPIGRKTFKGFLALRHWLQTNRVDVLNTHSSTDSWLVALACATLRNAPPVVRTRHISAPVTNNSPTRWLYTKATQHIVTTGEALRQTLVHENGYPAQMISSVPTGIDPQRFSPGDKATVRRQLGLDLTRNYLGIVATLRSWKGHLYLLDAFASLSSGLKSQWSLLVVGDGPMRQVLEARVLELGLADQVSFVGQQSAPENWLRALDIFCLPSYANEGVPQAILQAMFTGLPIITTPVGAIGEAICDGKTGLMVEPSNSQTLAATLQKLMERPELRTHLAESVRLAALKSFSRDHMLEQMEAVFDSVVAMRKSLG